MALIGVDDGAGHVHRFTAYLHTVRFVAAGAQDGTAVGQDAGEQVTVEIHGAVLDEAAKAITEADAVHPEGVLAGFADTAYGGVEAGAIAAAGENADVLWHNVAVLLVDADCAVSYLRDDLLSRSFFSSMKSVCSGNFYD